MAIFHLKVSTITRGAGRSATAAAAYRSRSAIDDERTGEHFDYSRRADDRIAGGVVGWSGGAGDLWNRAELAERRKDARVAREVVVAIPHELSAEEQQRLVRGFALSLRDRHGVAVQYDIHRPDKGGDHRNTHAHLLLTTRRVRDGQLTEKTRELDDTKSSGQHIEAWREEWERRCNAALERHAAGRQQEPQRIDRRSHRRRYRDAGLSPDLAPAPLEHLGPAVAALERGARGRPRRTARGDRNRERRSLNAEKAATIINLKDALDERERARQVELERRKKEREQHGQDWLARVQQRRRQREATMNQKQPPAPVRAEPRPIIQNVPPPVRPELHRPVIQRQHAPAAARPVPAPPMPNWSRVWDEALAARPAKEKAVQFARTIAPILQHHGPAAVMHGLRSVPHKRRDRWNVVRTLATIAVQAATVVATGDAPEPRTMEARRVLPLLQDLLDIVIGSGDDGRGGYER